MPMRLWHGLRLVMLCASLLGGAVPASAVTLCTVGATVLAFGSVSSLSSTATTSTATITVSCTTTLAALAAVPYTLSMGVSATSGTMTRSLAGLLGARLNYNVYTTAAYSSVWGDGSAGTSQVSGSVTPTTLAIPVTASHTAYGKVPLPQVVTPGSYADSMTVTVNY